MNFLDKLNELNKRKHQKKGVGKFLLFSYPKAGKTMAALTLPDKAYHLDFEGGTEYFKIPKDKLVIPFYLTRDNQEKIDLYKSMLKSFKEKKEKVPFIVVDTITSAYDTLINALAVDMYNKDKNVAFPYDKDLSVLPYGLGAVYKRDALKRFIRSLEHFADTVIILGHVAEKELKNAEGMASIKEIDLEGKAKNIFAANVDAIGLLTRAENVSRVQFNQEQVIGGSRIKSWELLGDTELIVFDPKKDQYTIYWNKLFPEYTKEPLIIKREEINIK